MRRISRILIAAIGAAMLAPMAWATPIPADPVERCRGILRAIPLLKDFAPETERIDPIGTDGCKFTGVTGESGQGNTSIGLILAERLDFGRVYDGRLPDAITLHIQGITLGGDGLPPGLGSFDITADYDLDTKTKVLTVRELTFRGPSLGDLTMSGELEGYSLPVFGGFWPDADDQKTIGLRRFRLQAADRGFIRVLLLGQSSSGGYDRAALDRLKTEISANLARWPDFGVPGPAVTALTAFIGDLPSPRRPITISAAPSVPIPLASLYPTDPGLRQAMERLNLTIDY